MLISKNFKYALWVLAGLVFLWLIGNFYTLFFRPTVVSGNNNIMFMLAIGLLLGGVLMFLLLKLNARANNRVTESSHTVVESMRKVFKIVCAEGQFNELYDYEETKKLLGFFPSRKKALVIVKAKVLVGYDFEKLKWEKDEENRVVRLIDFPEAEILSIETDYKYYNLEENIFDMFSREDLSTIQQNGKKQVMLAALGSDLPKMASDQMRTLLTEMLQSNQWQIENSYKITGIKKIENTG